MCLGSDGWFDSGILGIEGICDKREIKREKKGIKLICLVAYG